jgi:hypothetical protein
MSRLKVYIAGPMRGYPDWNFAAFDQAENLWRCAGWHPLSPAQTCRALGYALTPGQDPTDSVDREHLLHVMQTDIACIYAADALALLPGWEKSVGATVELSIAQFLNLPVYDAVTMENLYPRYCPWAVINDNLAAAHRDRIQYTGRPQSPCTGG